MAGFFGGRDLCNRIWAPQTRVTTLVGNTQAQTNTVNLPPGPLPGDLALFYGIVNTSSSDLTPSTQGISAGPAGWTPLSGAALAQVATTPVFVTRAVWWKVLTAADIATAAVSFTPGSLVTFAACGVMVFRGASVFTLLSSGGVGASTSVNQSQPATSAGTKLYINLMCLRADLAEVIHPPAGWTNVYPGVMFAGAFYFSDPTTYAAQCAGIVGNWSWTTASGGFNHFIKAS